MSKVKRSPSGKVIQVSESLTSVAIPALGPAAVTNVPLASTNPACTVGTPVTVQVEDGTDLGGIGCMLGGAAVTAPGVVTATLINPTAGPIAVPAIKFQVNYDTSGDS